MATRIAVIGGGIVGLATARALHGLVPDAEIVVFEKDSTVGTGQTGHNSGVVHSGIYYRPGTLKARLCVDGARRMRAYCEDRDLPRRTVGKVVVAVTEEELPGLEELGRRGAANGVEDVELLDREGLRRVEPAVRGIAALYLPGAMIVDFRMVCVAIARELDAAGVDVRVGAPVEFVQETADGVLVGLAEGTERFDVAVNCAGLYADRVAGSDPHGPRIVPFRGEYYALRPGAAARIAGMVYPVPDPRFPFLGVHLTPTIDGGVEAGPNAVLAFAREGYRRTDVDVHELWWTLSFPGFRRLAAEQWRSGLAELRRSFSAKAFAAELARLLPWVTPRDLRRTRSGVRAQAVGPDGALLDDFVVSERGMIVDVISAPSPAATAAFAIADHLAGMVTGRMTAIGGDDS